MRITVAVKNYGDRRKKCKFLQYEGEPVYKNWFSTRLFSALLGSTEFSCIVIGKSGFRCEKCNYALESGFVLLN